MVRWSDKHAHWGDTGRKDKTLWLLKNMEMKLKSQQPCSAVSALLGLISLAQLVAGLSREARVARVFGCHMTDREYVRTCLQIVRVG